MGGGLRPLTRERGRLAPGQLEDELNKSAASAYMNYTFLARMSIVKCVTSTSSWEQAGGRAGRRI